jgi:cytochrome b561
LDSRADEFSFSVPICAATPTIQGWVEGTPEMSSGWQQFAAVFMPIAFFVLFGLMSLFGAFGYRVQGSSVQMSRLKHR